MIEERTADVAERERDASVRLARRSTAVTRASTSDLPSGATDLSSSRRARRGDRQADHPAPGTAHDTRSRSASTPTPTGSVHARRASESDRCGCVTTSPGRPTTRPRPHRPSSMQHAIEQRKALHELADRLRSAASSSSRSRSTASRPRRSAGRGRSSATSSSGRSSAPPLGHPRGDALRRGGRAVVRHDGPRGARGGGAPARPRARPLDRAVLARGRRRARRTGRAGRRGRGEAGEARLQGVGGGLDRQRDEALRTSS